jgi:hypothetical protein
MKINQNEIVELFFKKIHIIKKCSENQILIWIVLSNILFIQIIGNHYALAVVKNNCSDIFNNSDLSVNNTTELRSFKAPVHEYKEITAEELVAHAEKGISLVPEFQFIRETAQKMGVRVWLFGGTASSFLHYVKWDLARSRGHIHLQQDRFDYDYTNIFRSTQDLDIAIDATPETAGAFQEIIAEKFPHFLGAKAKWEVRTLRHRMGKEGEVNFKEALLDDSDFNNQNTDSNSLGMVELTYDKNKFNEPLVRDLKNWDKPISVFLEDTLKNRISYFRSQQHFTTARAQAGENPEILSVIRLLVKAFQYELTFSKNDFEQMKQVVNEFDGSAISNSNALRRIHDTAKKLVMHATNIEYALNKLDELGLRQKLISLGDANSIESDAWWLSREPLRSKPVGTGKGNTAAELNIKVVAHETNNFLAYESITRAHSGEPNVFISRQNSVGEAAAFGEGFYTKIGKEGARGTGLTIRFEVNPKAREGTDFIIKDNCIIFINKKALSVIQESLNYGLEDLLKLAESKLVIEVDHSDLALLEKLKRKLNATKINEELTKLLTSPSQEDHHRLILFLSALQDSNINKLINENTLISVVRNVFHVISNLAKSTSDQDLLRYIQTVGPIAKTLDKYKILNTNDFLNYLRTLIKTHTKNFEFQKQVTFELILQSNIYQEQIKLKDIFISEKEIREIQSEIENWHLSKDHHKRKYALDLNHYWTQAIENEELLNFRPFLESGIFTINHKNFSEVSILQLAAYYKHTKLINWIINNPDFDFNAKNKSGYTEVEQLMLIGKIELAHQIMDKRPEVIASNFQIKERNSDGTPIIDFIKINPVAFMMSSGPKDVLTIITKPFEFMSTHITHQTYSDVLDLYNKNIKHKFYFTFPDTEMSQFPAVYLTYLEVESWIEALNSLSNNNSIKIQKTLEKLFPGHKLGDIYRLPTSAEWELVARLGGVAIGHFSFGNLNSEISDYIVYSRNTRGAPFPVGSKKPVFYNGKPIYDLQGNAWCWMNDWHTDELTGGIDPQGPSHGTNRITRGGSWNQNENSTSIRTRTSTYPRTRSNSGGFRIIRSRRY